MALIQMNFESKYMGSNNTVTVLIPECPQKEKPELFYAREKKYRVLWLLHGGWGDSSDWLRKSMIELYAQENQLIAVMPSVINSFYTNWPDVMMDVNAYDYFLKELMPLIYNWFPASDKPEDNYIAGLSMGAIGATKFVANNPHLFAGGAMFSAAPVDLHVPPKYPQDNNIVHQLTLANGGLEAAIASADNSWDILLKNKDKLPPMYFASGTDDVHYKALYLPFKQYAQEVGLPITFEESAGYDHEWRFWDIAIQRALEFFGMKVRK